MPPSMRSIGRDGQTIQLFGEILAGVFYAFLILSAIVPSDLWPIPYRTRTYLFIGLFVVVVFSPPPVKLLSEGFGRLSQFAAYLGEFPFHHFTLYYHPLLDRQVQTHWPDGLYYATLTYNDGDSYNEHLLLDSMIEPMNISGLVLHFLPTVLQSDDPAYRKELMQFLTDFLLFKIGYYTQNGEYSISRRYLGRLSFPTANTQTEPDHDLSTENIESINIHHIRWPETISTLDLPNMDWSSTSHEHRELVALYAVDEEGNVSEEYFNRSA